eukprot:371189-Amphidinium_carterae.1
MSVHPPHMSKGALSAHRQPGERHNRSRKRMGWVLSAHSPAKHVAVTNWSTPGSMFANSKPPALYANWALTQQH